MQKILLSFFLLLACTGTGFAQSVNFYVPPHATDTAYAINQDSSYVAYDSTITANNKMLLFIGGTGSLTAGYTDFANLASQLGYHAIIVAYKDTPEVAKVCDLSSDSLCYDNFRQQVCFGTPVSTANVDTLNSIVMRAYNLVKYLSATYPRAGWGQFIQGGQLLWSKVAVAGHSQGSGHSMFIAKQLKCERVNMFSGADDYSIYFNTPAPWESRPSATPASSLFSFLSLGNENEPYYIQYEIVQVLGMTATGDDSTDVDGASPPYNNSHCLYTDATPQHTGTSAYHGSTVANYYTPLIAGTPLFTPVWTYMLTDSLPFFYTGVSNLHINEAVIYPDPASNALNIIMPMQYAANLIHIQLLNSLGQQVLASDYMNYIGTLQLMLPMLPAGIYVLYVTNGKNAFAQKVVIDAE